MRIIYVEDNPANVALVERISHMSHDELMTFDDPDTALASIHPGTADLILMDVNLGSPSMNGLELTRMLRTKGISEPIVVITAYDAMGYPEQFQTAGFNEYVLKPVSVRSMIDLINAYRPA
ncbi:MAG: response regulator [Phototrophicaceae bacterium]|jgi:CheY-like chemotaxis protein